MRYSLGECCQWEVRILTEILFDGKREVSNEETVDKMNYFIEKAKNGMGLFEKNKKESLIIGKELRNELNAEYKNNSLVRIETLYKDHELFYAFYKPAVHQALVSVTGSLSYEKLYGFLYDVEDYMSYHIPIKYKQ